MLASHNFNLYFLGISYKSSPVEIRERFAFLPAEIKGYLPLLKKKLGPLVCLSTCNRTELYFSSNLSAPKAKSQVQNLLAELKGLSPSLIREHTKFLADEVEIAKHLFRVSAGLESMILGEGQILNQLKNAYAESQSFTNNILNQLFQRALATGKKVRTKTNISKGAVSVPAAALQLIQKQIYPLELENRQIMILGAGQIAQVCLELLHSQGVANLVLVSRSPRKNQNLCKYEIAEHLDYQNLTDHISHQDILFVCTSAPHYIINKQIIASDRSKSLIICDLSLPRNVDPALKGEKKITLLDLDYLNDQVSRNVSQRSQETLQAESIIYEEIHKFFIWKKKALKLESNLSKLITVCSS